MHTDPIADLLTRIRNAIHAHHEKVQVPYSTIKENILKILKEKGFIEDYSTTEIQENRKDKTLHKVLEIILKEGTEHITFKRVSKPGQRIYVKREDLKSVKSGLGISIVSTSKGLMTNGEARSQNMGGELVCQIY